MVHAAGRIAYNNAATCLLEGTNVSEARGTLHPFEHIAAPRINAKDLSDQLNS